MLTDSEIIKRCRAGQTELFDILIERYKDNVFGFCIKLSGKRYDAEDLFQDTWVRVMSSINNYLDNGRFLQWVLTICINLYRDGYRKRTRWIKRVFNVGDDEQGSLHNITHKTALQDEILHSREQEVRLRREIALLDDTYKLPLILYYYREFSLNDISEILDIPEGTVKSRLSKARQLLKKTLGVSNE